MVTNSAGVVGTNWVAYEAAQNVLHAVRYCTDRGTPITHMLTVDLSWVAAPHEPGQVLKELRKRVARWWRDQCQRKGRALGPLMSAVVQANPGGHHHAHWLQRLLPGMEMEFMGVVIDRLAKIAGVAVSIASDACHLTPTPAPGSLAKYALKGIKPSLADHFHIDGMDEGFVPGRRTSVSRAISRTARKDDGWVRRRRPRS
jgi:hypothetical protein